jgi:hypothetical protein
MMVMMMMMIMMMMIIPTYVLNSHYCRYEQTASKLVRVNINKLSAVLGIALNSSSLLHVAVQCVAEHNNLYRHNYICMSELHHVSQNTNKHQKSNAFQIAMLCVLLPVLDLMMPGQGSRNIKTRMKT